jgi:hypothetical protein
MALRPATSFVIGLLVLAAICPLLAQRRSERPRALSQFLSSRPDLRTVSMTDAPDVFDARGVGSYFRPWVQADLTGDNEAEVAAVVVQTAPSVRYGVVVLHRSTPHWAVPLANSRIVSVVVQGTRLYIETCIECDSNSFVRWNGTAYEWELYERGETVATFDRASNGRRRVVIRQAPDVTSPSVGVVQQCSEATVVTVGPRRVGRRWYEVRTNIGDTSLVGFVTGDSVAEVACN